MLLSHHFFYYQIRYFYIYIMARTKKVNYNEDDLIDLFNLTRIADKQTPEMQRWLNVTPPVLDVVEQGIFDRILPFAVRDIAGWGEEERVTRRR